MMLLKAFLVGGTLCMLGQVLVDRTRLTPARILSGYVVAGVVLSALGLYQPLVDFAGAGATVPLTGFSHLLAKGVREAVRTDGFLGALTQKERRIFLARYFYLLPVREIAARLGCRQGTVKSSLFRSREKLRSTLVKEGYVC